MYMGTYGNTGSYTMNGAELGVRTVFFLKSGLKVSNPKNHDGTNALRAWKFTE